MSNQLFSNNASTTIGSAIGSTATTITVASGSGALFPTITAGQFFSATLFAASSTTGIPNEIVYVTARSGDTMTVVRGREGTTAQAWSVGDVFANFPTAGFFNNVVGSSDIQSQFGNSGVDSGTANAGAVTLSPTVLSLSSILYSPIRVLKTSAANTSAYTLNVNGLGAKNVTLSGGALVSGQLPASQVFEVVWDGTNFELLSLPDNIPNSSLAPMAANTIKANLTGSTANPSDTTIPALLTSLGFGAYSLSNAGYYNLPNGLLIQWKSITAYDDATEVVTFPIAFPNACWYVFTTIQLSNNPTAGGGNTLGCWGAPSPSSNKTQANISYNSSTGDGSPNPVTVGFWAIGY